MLTRIHDPERGANFVEYAAVILLVAAITSTVLGSGITGRVSGLIEGAVESVGTPEDGPDPQAGGEHADEPHRDTPSGDQQPAAPQADPANNNDDAGPLDFTPTLETDLGPGNGSDESFAPLGLDNLMAGPPSGGLTPTYSTGDLGDDIADLADDAAESQERATREGLEMAEGTIQGPIELAQDLREDTSGTFRRGAENAIAGATELHDEYASTVRDSAELIRQGFGDGEYLGGLWDGASHLEPQPKRATGHQRGRLRAFRQRRVRGGTRPLQRQRRELVHRRTRPQRTDQTPQRHRPQPRPRPRTRADPEAQHLAEGETDNQGQNRDKDDTDEPNGNCRTNSFTPGTPVLMANGSTTPIEDVETGDEVLAFDPTTGEEGPREVTNLISGTGEKTLVDITTTDTDGDTSTLTATDEHPFWTPKAAQWVNATDLDPGTWLRTSTGTWTQVTAVEADIVEDQQVHNLTINDLHTYYVGDGASTALVHNSGPRDRCDDSAQEQGVSLKKSKEKQLKNILKDKYDTEPHEFKEDYVGQNDVAKFDASKGDDGHLWLVSKNGKVTIQTHETWR